MGRAAGAGGRAPPSRPPLTAPGERRPRLLFPRGGEGRPEAAERGRAVTFDEDALAHLVARHDAQSDRREARDRVVGAHVQRLHVGLEELLLALVLLADEALDLLELDAEQGRERAHVDDVLEELALAR